MDQVQQVPLAQMGRSSRAGATDNDVVVIDDDSPAQQQAPRDIPLEMLEKALENACETLATLATNVIDFSYDSQHVLFSKVNEFVGDLQEIDKRGKNVNASIPMDVIDVIDKGRNPELCTYQMLESCADASNVVRGKLSAVQSFKAELEKSLHEARAQGSLQPVKDDAAGKTMNMQVETSIAGNATNGVPPTGGPSNGF